MDWMLPDLGSLAEGLPSLILEGVERSPLLGYGLIATAMLLENLIPPIPSELIMPLGGVLVEEGRLDFLPVVLAGLLGTVLGAWFWYWVGRLIRADRLAAWLGSRGRLLGLGPETLASSQAWFGNHGAAVVFWGRLLPAIRTLVSVPAGMESMPQLPFLLWTTAGSLIWVLVLTLVGMVLGSRAAELFAALGPISGWLSICVLLLLGLRTMVPWLSSKLQRQRQN
jgi:membrane protein DedA with SNARE-associated domain